MRAGDPTHEETIGGKKVRTAGPGSYVYASGDTVYFISGDPEPSLELLAALP